MLVCFSQGSVVIRVSSAYQTTSVLVVVYLLTMCVCRSQCTIAVARSRCIVRVYVVLGLIPAPHLIHVLIPPIVNLPNFCSFFKPLPSIKKPGIIQNMKGKVMHMQHFLLTRVTVVNFTVSININFQLKNSDVNMRLCVLKH